MAGRVGKSGRRKSSGTVYRFDFYYRFVPGEDPPELELLLQALVEAEGRKRRDMLRAALLGGAQHAQALAAQAEDSEVTGLVDEMLADF